MKKFILPALLMIVAVGFIACGNKDNSNSQCGSYSGTTQVNSVQTMATIYNAYGQRAFAYPTNLAYSQSTPSYACVYTQAYNSVMGISGGSGGGSCPYAFQASDGSKECCATNNPYGQCYPIY